MADKNGSILWYNQRWFDFTGVSNQEIEGWNWKPLIQPGQLDDVLNKWRKALDTGEPLENIFEMRGKDGAYRWFLVRGVPIRNDKGEVAGWLGTNTDITDQRKDREILSEQNRLLNLSFDAILVRDRDDRITFWNHGAEELYGWSAAEAIGKVSHALLGTEFPEGYEGVQAILRQTGRWEGELIHTRRNGSRVRVISRWVQDRDAQRRPKMVLESNNDISARRKTEMELRATRGKLARLAGDLEQTVNERTADLRASLAELESVSYSLSHDMRAPLRAIHSFCHIVLKEAGERLNPLERDLLEKSISAANRLDALIRDVLIYNRVSRDEIKFSAIDVEHLLRQIIHERPEFQPPRATIEINSPLHTVLGHEAYLTQCVTNILDNAVKFVAPGQQPHVRIWSEVQSGDVTIWFGDDGIGIPSDAQERVFGMFQRLHPDRIYPGTGIGLAIVRKAAERMGGAAGVESEPEKGSRFWLRLRSGE